MQGGGKKKRVITMIKNSGIRQKRGGKGVEGKRGERSELLLFLLVRKGEKGIFSLVAVGERGR